MPRTLLERLALRDEPQPPPRPPKSPIPREESLVRAILRRKQQLPDEEPAPIAPALKTSGEIANLRERLAAVGVEEPVREPSPFERFLGILDRPRAALTGGVSGLVRGEGLSRALERAQRGFAGEEVVSPEAITSEVAGSGVPVVRGIARGLEALQRVEAPEGAGLPAEIAAGTARFAGKLAPALLLDPLNYIFLGPARSTVQVAARNLAPRIITEVQTLRGATLQPATAERLARNALAGAVPEGLMGAAVRRAMGETVEPVTRVSGFERQVQLSERIRREQEAASRTAEAERLTQQVAVDRGVAGELATREGELTQAARAAQAESRRLAEQAQAQESLVAKIERERAAAVGQLEQDKSRESFMFQRLESARAAGQQARERQQLMFSRLEAEENAGRRTALRLRLREAVAAERVAIKRFEQVQKDLTKLGLSIKERERVQRVPPIAGGARGVRTFEPPKDWVPKLEAVIDRANPEVRNAGRIWWDNTRQVAGDLSELYGVDARRVAAALAAGSARTPWERNVRNVLSVLDHHAKGGRFDDLPELSLNRFNDAKMWAAVSGERIEGIFNFGKFSSRAVAEGRDPLRLFGPGAPKTRAMQRLAERPGTAVTPHPIDTIIGQGLGLPVGAVRGAYRQAETAMIRAARAKGLIPEQAGATAWVQLRKERFGIEPGEDFFRFTARRAEIARLSGEEPKPHVVDLTRERRDILGSASTAEELHREFLKTPIRGEPTLSQIFISPGGKALPTEVGEAADVAFRRTVPVPKRAEVLPEKVARSGTTRGRSYWLTPTGSFYGGLLDVHHSSLLERAFGAEEAGSAASRYGLIRVSMAAGNGGRPAMYVDILTKPTQAQMRAIREVVEDLPDGQLYWEVGRVGADRGGTGLHELTRVFEGVPGPEEMARQKVFRPGMLWHEVRKIDPSLEDDVAEAGQTTLELGIGRGHAAGYDPENTFLWQVEGHPQGAQWLAAQRGKLEEQDWVMVFHEDAAGSNFKADINFKGGVEVSRLEELRATLTELTPGYTVRSFGIEDISRPGAHSLVVVSEHVEDVAAFRARMRRLQGVLESEGVASDVAYTRGRRVDLNAKRGDFDVVLERGPQPAETELSRAAGHVPPEAGVGPEGRAISGGARGGAPRGREGLGGAGRAREGAQEGTLADRGRRGAEEEVAPPIGGGARRTPSQLQGAAEEAALTSQTLRRAGGEITVGARTVGGLARAATETAPTLRREAETLLKEAKQIRAEARGIRPKGRPITEFEAAAKRTEPRQFLYLAGRPVKDITPLTTKFGAAIARVPGMAKIRDAFGRIFVTDYTPLEIQGLERAKVVRGKELIRAASVRGPVVATKSLVETLRQFKGLSKEAREAAVGIVEKTIPGGAAAAQQAARIWERIRKVDEQIFARERMPLHLRENYIYHLYDDPPKVVDRVLSQWRAQRVDVRGVKPGFTFERLGPETIEEAEQLGLHPRKDVALLAAIHHAQTVQLATFQRVGKDLIALGPKAVSVKEIHGYVQLGNEIPILAKKWVHPEIAVSLRTLYPILANTDAGIRTLTDLHNGFITAWKSMVLATPGFHLRNFFGNIWLNAADGMLNPGRYPQALAVFTRSIKEVELGGKKVPVEAILRNFEERGLKGQGAFSEVLTTKSITKQADAALKALERGGITNVAYHAARPLKVSQNVGSWADSLGRMANYLHRLDQGFDFGQAAALTRRALFDYSRLTPAERQIRLFVPFYAWMRNNIPRMVDRMIGAPGMFSSSVHVRDTLVNLNQVDEENVPQWLRDNQAIPVWVDAEGNIFYVTANFPYTDLSRIHDPREIQEWGREIMSMLGPQLTLVPQIAVNVQAFTGRPITDTPEIKSEALKDYGRFLLKTFGIPGRFAGGIGEEQEREALKQVRAERGELPRPETPRLPPIGLPLTVQHPAVQAGRALFEQRERLQQAKRVAETQGKKVPTVEELERRPQPDKTLVEIATGAKKPRSEVPIGPAPRSLVEAARRPALKVEEAPTVVRKSLQSEGADQSWGSWMSYLLSRENAKADPYAENETAIDPRTGRPSPRGERATGLFQMLPSTFRAHADKGWSIYNSEHNARAAIRYIKARYGHPSRIPNLTTANYKGY